MENKIIENEKLLEDYKQKVNEGKNKFDEIQNIINKEKKKNRYSRTKISRR